MLMKKLLTEKKAVVYMQFLYKGNLFKEEYILSNCYHFA